MVDEGVRVNEDQQSAEQRLDALWREYAPAVVRYAQRRVLPAEVDEVVAETFLVAWRRLEAVPDYPLPWLLGVARGVSANVRRTARRRDALTDRLLAVTDRDAVQIDQAGEEVTAPLRQAL